MSFPRLEEAQPVVSVVVPMLNELGFIEACLAGFAAQTYPADRLDVIVVDGGSTDGSRAAVDAMARSAGWVRVVDNPRRKASAAFNEGVRAARGEVVCLFSAHGVADPTWVERSVAVLKETGAAGVGGRCPHVGLTASSRAVGLAMMSPFGMASPTRYSTRRQEIDTIIHPAYVRKALAGFDFDESLERNSDYELNWRLREAGARLVFDPSITSTYRPRGSLKALARQFWWYGRWKARVVERHPRSLKPRHLAPPAAVAGAALAPLLLPFGWGRRLVRAARAAGAAYGGLVVAACVQGRPHGAGASPAVFVAAFPVMHFSWGAGFLFTWLRDWVRRPRR